MKRNIKFTKLNLYHLIEKRESLVFTIVIVFVLIAGCTTIFERPSEIKEHIYYPDDRPVNRSESAENVSEEIITEDFEWQGEQNHPKYINLPSITSSGFIENNGINSKNEIAVPANVHKAGWFDQSSLPGQRGLSIISGHLNGPSRNTNGIFANLDQLRSGQQFTVELGNGQILNYEVMEVNTYSYEEAAQYLFSQKPEISSQLNLITCSGNFDTEISTFDERTIVVSKLVE